MPCGVASRLRSSLAFRSSCRRAFCSSIVSRSACPPSPLLLASLGFLSSWLSPRITSRPAPLLSSPHRPANRVEKRGDIAFAYRHAWRLCLLGLVPLSSKCFPRHPFKTFLDNFLKTFRVNLLDMAKYVSLSICPPRISAVVSLCVAACCPVVLSIACVVSWLKRRVFSDSVPSRLSPRFPSRHSVMPAVRPCSHQAVLAAHRYLLRLGSLRFPPIVPSFSDAPPNRHAWRGEERDGDGCLAGSCYMRSCGII